MRGRDHLALARLVRARDQIVMPAQQNRGRAEKDLRGMQDLPVTRCQDASRARELLVFTHGVFGALVIDPPSSVLKETEADFAARLADETCFIIEADGRLVGSVFCKRKDDALYIGRLAVAPDWRRRGVATALINTAKDEARRI